ncbi:MAG: hypothetical protein ACRCU1_00410 [Alsobacter sp.]
MRQLYEGMAIAQVFPADATPEEERELLTYEQGIVARALNHQNPTLCGAMLGSVFKAREARLTARQDAEAAEVDALVEQAMTGPPVLGLAPHRAGAS